MEEKIISFFSNKFNGDDGAVVSFAELFAAALASNTSFLKPNSVLTNSANLQKPNLKRPASYKSLLNSKLVLSKDLFAQESHFKRGWLSLEEVGKKAVAVNVSDAVAMNATPVFALLGLGVGRDFDATMRAQLCGAINAECAKFGVRVIGGDTIYSPKLCISLSVISLINASDKPLFRTPSKRGDLVLFTGRLGEARKGLNALMRGGYVGVKSRFRNVVLRADFVKKSARFMRCGMDLSDGLASDLPKITKGFGVKFYRKLNKAEFCGGEDYEMLFTAPKRNLPRLLNEAKRARVRLSVLGKLVQGKVKTYGKFSHF
mgnify:CR=1 FL=1